MKNVVFYGEINGKKFTTPESFIEEYEKTKKLSILDDIYFDREFIFNVVLEHKEKLKKLLSHKEDILKMKGEFSEETLKSLSDYKQELEECIIAYDSVSDMCSECKKVIEGLFIDDKSDKIEENEVINENKSCCCQCDGECGCCHNDDSIENEELVNEVFDLIKTYFNI